MPAASQSSTAAAAPGADAGGRPVASVAGLYRRSRWQAFVDSRLLALEAALLLALARFLVKHVPFRRWRGWLTSAEPAGLPGAAGWRLPSVVHVARVVPRAAAMVPFEAVCLPQAMAGQWMLRRRGVPSRLSLGARRRAAAAGGEPPAQPSRRRIARRSISDDSRSGSGTDYHAWLCVDGRCVIGGPVDSYVRLPPFDAIPPRPRRDRPGSAAQNAE